MHGAMPISVAVCLLLYSLVVAVFAPRLLPAMTRAGVSPRLGLTAWLAAMLSVPMSWAAGAVFVAQALLDDPRNAVGACVGLLGAVAAGRGGVVGQFALMAVAGIGAIALVLLTTRLVRLLARARTHTYRHAEAALFVGRRIDGGGVVVLEAPERAAYCVAGRPHAIVVTSAALDVLDQRQLAAVLTHERAHLAGHHHLFLALARALATALPRLELFTVGTVEVARLLEMRADDAAAARHGGITVVSALLALSTPPAATPAGALGASGVDVVARAQRLVSPPGLATRAGASLANAVAVTVLVAGPLATGLLAGAGLGLCNPLS